MSLGMGQFEPIWVFGSHEQSIVFDSAARSAAEPRGAIDQFASTDVAEPWGHPSTQAQSARTHIGRFNRGVAEKMVESRGVPGAHLRGPTPGRQFASRIGSLSGYPRSGVSRAVRTIDSRPQMSQISADERQSTLSHLRPSTSSADNCFGHAKGSRN